MDNYFTNPTKITAFSDASYADDTNRNSTTGFILMLNNGPIAWSTKKQPIIAPSSTEAEFIALTQTIKKIKSVSNTLTELNITHKPLIVYIDNLSTINMTTHNNHHERTKHIDIKYHFIVNEVKINTVTLKHIPTDHNLADAFTKPLQRIKLNFFNNMMNIKQHK
jgi:hypothetical protein